MRYCFALLLPRKAIILIKAFERYFPLIWYYLCGKKWSQLCAVCAWNSISLYQRSVKATEQCSLVVLFTLLYCSHSFNLCGKKSAAVFPLTWNRLCSTFYMIIPFSSVLHHGTYWEFWPWLFSEWYTFYWSISLLKTRNKYTHSTR